MQPDNIENQFKEILKENKLLKKKLSLCSAQREDIENVMIQTRTLLENVLKEETLNQLMMFRKFVPPEFLSSLNKKSILDIHLGDHTEREMTILFSDIRSFTSLSESMSPEENFNFINEYLKYVEPGIYLNRGFIDKFIGDAIMALFYSPDDAIQAAIDMQRALNIFNDVRAKQSKIPIKIGIGLHTGLTMIGIIGVTDRMQSTVISDAVNVASRIETMTKQFDASILASGFTLSKVDQTQYKKRFLGKVKALGEKEEVDLFDIFDAERPEIAELKLKSLGNIENGLELFFKRKFAKASVEFTAALDINPDDKAALYYLKFCSQYMIQGVPEGWDGSTILLIK